MIRFDFDGTEYGLQFRHSEVLADSIGVPNSDVEETRRITLVDIVEADSKVPVAHGMSICHPYDPFVKDEGRRRALTSAFTPQGNTLVDNKAFRKAAWEAYFGR